MPNANRFFYVVEFKDLSGSFQYSRTFAHIRNARKHRDFLQTTSWAVAPRIMKGGPGGMEVV